MILIIGAISSGKSAYAEGLVCSLQGRRIYLATMSSKDDESKMRIKRHIEQRNNKNFITLECPVEVDTAEVLSKDIVLLECLSNLLANEMFADMEHIPDIGAICDKIVQQLIKLDKRCGELIIVGNEIFSDYLKYDEETENFRQAFGNIQNKLGAIAKEVTEVIYGIPCKIK